MTENKKIQKSPRRFEEWDKTIVKEGVYWILQAEGSSRSLGRLTLVSEYGFTTEEKAESRIEQWERELIDKGILETESISIIPVEIQIRHEVYWPIQVIVYSRIWNMKNGWVR